MQIGHSFVAYKPKQLPMPQIQSHTNLVCEGWFLLFTVSQSNNSSHVLLVFRVQATLLEADRVQIGDSACICQHCFTLSS